MPVTGGENNSHFDIDTYIIILVKRQANKNHYQLDQGT